MGMLEIIVKAIGDVAGKIPLRKKPLYKCLEEGMKKQCPILRQ